MRLEGKVALITGGGSGMGAATARRFTADGARVVINDVNETNLKEVAAALPEGSAKTCAGDVTKVKDVERMIETALSFGRLDILVNSAGVDPPDREQDINKALDTWHKILEVNLTGPYLTMKLAVPHLIRSGGGSIINISSLSGIRYMGARPGYTASKAGLIGLTQMAAVEYGPVKVRCNVICPGAVRTPMFGNNMKPLAKRINKDVEDIFKQFTSFSPMGRIGEPEEIAGICSFLASEDSSLMTGGIYVADGGSSLVDIAGPAMRGFFR